MATCCDRQVDEGATAIVLFCVGLTVIVVVAADAVCWVDRAEGREGGMAASSEARLRVSIAKSNSSSDRWRDWKGRTHQIVF